MTNVLRAKKREALAYGMISFPTKTDRLDADGSRIKLNTRTRRNVERSIAVLRGNI